MMAMHLDGSSRSLGKRSPDSRDGLRKKMSQRRESLSSHEANFLELVAALGTDDEIRQAQRTLDDQKLFFLDEGIDEAYDGFDHTEGPGDAPANSPVGVGACGDAAPADKDGNRSTDGTIAKLQQKDVASIAPTGKAQFPCSQRRLERLEKRKSLSTFEGTNAMWKVVQASLKIKQGLRRLRSKHQQRRDNAADSQDAATKPRNEFVATIDSIEPTWVMKDLRTRHSASFRNSQVLSKVFESGELLSAFEEIDSEEEEVASQTSSLQSKNKRASMVRDEASLPGSMASSSVAHQIYPGRSSDVSGMESSQDGSDPAWKQNLATRYASVGEGFEIDLFNFLGEEANDDDAEIPASDAKQDSSSEIHDPWSSATSLPSNILSNGQNAHMAQTKEFRILGTSAEDESAKPHVLSPQTMESLQPHLPFAKRGESFWLRYSLVRDGASASTFLRQVRGAQHVLLAMENLEGEVFGAFTSSPWHIDHGYFGNGSAFVWKLRKPREFHDPLHEDDSQTARQMSIIEQMQNEEDVEVYPWTMTNHCLQTCQKGRISVGGGTINQPQEIYLHQSNSTAKTFGSDNPGKESKSDENDNRGASSLIMPHQWGFALCFEDDSMLETTTSPCVTFQSPALSNKHSDGSRCELINVEAWSLTPCLSVSDAEILEGGRLFLQRNLTV